MRQGTQTYFAAARMGTSLPEFEASDGVRLHYLDEGAGPPLVFIHGWMMSGAFFRRQVDALRATRRCIAPDLRGCGRSQALPGTHTLDRFAEDLHELLETLDVQGSTVVGWSLGGGITMRYLDRHGAARLEGVGLVDFPPRFREEASVADKVCAKLKADRPAFWEGFLRRMFLSPPEPKDLEWMKSEIERCATETGCEMYRQLPVGSAEGQRYDLPALLCFPTQGWFPAALQEWKAIFPNHHAPEFRHSRHTPFWEEADVFNAALARFPHTIQTRTP